MLYCRHLCGKFSEAEGSVCLQDFLLEWQQEVWWKWAGLMSSQVDRDRYWEVVSHALKKYLNQEKMASDIRRYMYYDT